MCLKIMFTGNIRTVIGLIIKAILMMSIGISTAPTLIAIVKTAITTLRDYALKSPFRNDIIVSAACI